MENWKTVLVAGSVAAGLYLLLKGKHSAGLVVAGLGAATLASEYPDKFAEVRDNAEHYMARGITFLDVASKVGQRISDVSRGGFGDQWYERLLEEED
ncbi:MAG TPA: hypothetical protein VH088_13580 [Terriglobales bacterium]|jgi:hypothetical protein|nr:hypothetical protein [Terriglobales bacterium]